jgi:hypothetical protein
VGPQPLSLEALQGRLLKLEMQNRRFKQVGVAALILPALILLMGQANSKKTIEANEFVLKDSGGKIRANISVDESTKTSIAQMVLFDSNGQQKVRVDSGWPGLAGGTIILSGENGQTDSLTSNYLSIMGDVNVIGTGTTMSKEGLYITDKEGFEAIVGVSPPLLTPRTGETHKTSAASLALFDKDKNVIWKAP